MANDISDIIPDSAIVPESSPDSPSPTDDILPPSAFHADPQAIVTGTTPESSSLWNKYVGYMETEAKAATGGVASLAGGTAYLGSLALTRDPEKASQAQQYWQNKLTYEPGTKLGQQYSSQLDNDMSYLGQKGGDIAGSWAAEKSGSPVLGAEVNALYNVPQFLLGGKAGKEVNPTVEGVASDIPGREFGLKVPPSTTNPTMLNQTIEGGLAGKLSTAQHASAINQPIINDVVRQEFGIPKEAELTPETLQSVRDAASGPYKAISAIPEIKFGPAYNAELEKLTGKSQQLAKALPNFKSSGAQQVNDLIDSLKPVNGAMSGEAAVEFSKVLRSEASDYWASSKRTGDPVQKSLAKAYSGAAGAVENAVENHLKDIGQPDLADQWDQARRTIAKTYSVQSALDGAGNVDVRNLGKQKIKGKPLSDNLDKLADFGNSFKKAANPQWSKESVPGISPLDTIAAAGLSVATGLGTHNAWGALAGAGVPLTRTAARAFMLSKAGQQLGVPGRVPEFGTLGQTSLSGLPAQGEENQ